MGPFWFTNPHQQSVAFLSATSLLVSDTVVFNSSGISICVYNSGPLIRILLTHNAEFTLSMLLTSQIVKKVRVSWFPHRSAAAVPQCVLALNKELSRNKSNSEHFFPISFQLRSSSLVGYIPYLFHALHCVQNLIWEMWINLSLIVSYICCSRASGHSASNCSLFCCSAQLFLLFSIKQICWKQIVSSLGLIDSCLLLK